MQDKIKNDALKDGLIEKKKNFKKEKIKNIEILAVGFIITIIIRKLFFKSVDGVYIENAFVLLVIFVIEMILSVAPFVYPIMAILILSTIEKKYKLDPYFRTKKGKELNREIEGLKRFLKDYTLLNEKDRNEIIIWEEYLVYSVLFNQNKKIIGEYKKYLQ